jgi:hypothetical protein
VTWGKLSKSEAQRVTGVSQEEFQPILERGQKGSKTQKGVLGRGTRVPKEMGIKEKTKEGSGLK